MIRRMSGDNMSVILNSSLNSITLKNKHNVIGYHLVREVVAAGLIELEHVILENNYANILTKALSITKQYDMCKALIFTTTI